MDRASMFQKPFYKNLCPSINAVVLRMSNDNQLYFSSSMNMKSNTWTYIHKMEKCIGDPSCCIGIMSMACAKQTSKLLHRENDYSYLFSKKDVVGVGVGSGGEGGYAIFENDSSLNLDVYVDMDEIDLYS